MHPQKISLHWPPKRPFYRSTAEAVQRRSVQRQFSLTTYDSTILPDAVIGSWCSVTAHRALIETGWGKVSTFEKSINLENLHRRAKQTHPTEQRDPEDVDQDSRPSPISPSISVSRARINSVDDLRVSYLAGCDR